MPEKIKDECEFCGWDTDLTEVKSQRNDEKVMVCNVCLSTVLYAGLFDHRIFGEQLEIYRHINRVANMVIEQTRPTAR